MSSLSVARRGGEQFGPLARFRQHGDHAALVSQQRRHHTVVERLVDNDAAESDAVVVRVQEAMRFARCACQGVGRNRWMAPAAS